MKAGDVVLTKTEYPPPAPRQRMILGSPVECEWMLTKDIELLEKQK